MLDESAIRSAFSAGHFLFLWLSDPAERESHQTAEHTESENENGRHSRFHSRCKAAITVKPAAIIATTYSARSINSPSANKVLPAE
jgi:hypothetical protein